MFQPRSHTLICVTGATKLHQFIFNSLISGGACPRTPPPLSGDACGVHGSSAAQVR